MVKYYLTNFYVQGKWFDCIIKHKEQDNYWICLYLNSQNNKDWFIRSEVISQDYLRKSKEIEKEEYESRLNNILKLL